MREAEIPPRPDDDEVAEFYELRWPGKAEARRLAAVPSRYALAPAPAPDDSARPVMAEQVCLDQPCAEHLFLEGDNLDALKLLAGTHAGRVQLIYIDPPYNTGNDLTYPDDFSDSRADYLRRTGGRAGAPLTRSAVTSGRTHARWLSMLYPRLLLARRLLRADGALCLSIGEEEVHHARLLLNEVFGEEHHRNTLVVRRHDKNLSRQFMARGLVSLAVGFEYILIYARTTTFTMHPVFRAPSPRRRVSGYWKGFWNAADRPTMRYPLLGVTPAAGQWKWCEAVAREAVANYAEYQASHAAARTLEEHWEATGRHKRFLRRNPAGRGRNQGVEHWIPPSSGILRTSDWTDVLASGAREALDLPFHSPKSAALLHDLLRLCGDRDGIVLDFFAGSGTTAEAVLSLNREDGGGRRFLLVQAPEPTGDPRFPTIAAIAKERIRRALAAMPAADGMGFRVLQIIEPPDPRR